MKKQEYIKRLGEWKWLIRERMINEGYKKYFVIKRSHLFIIDWEKKKKIWCQEDRTDPVFEQFELVAHNY